MIQPARLAHAVDDGLELARGERIERMDGRLGASALMDDGTHLGHGDSSARSRVAVASTATPAVQLAARSA